MVGPQSRQGVSILGMPFLLKEGTTQTVETVFCVLVASQNISVVPCLNRNRLQWWGSSTGCWLKANNPPLYHRVQRHLVTCKWARLCVPAPPCPSTAAPPPFPCSSLAAGIACPSSVKSRLRGALQGVCSEFYQGSGESDVSVCWKVLAFSSWWEPSVFSLGRTAAFWNSHYRVWAAALLSCISSILNSEENCSTLNVQNNC